LRLSRTFWILAAILALALFVRLLGIYARPLWYDEAFSILFARTGLQSMLAGTLGAGTGSAAEEHPLLYYLLLWCWMRLFGFGLASARSLSILFGLATIWLVYRFSSDLFGESPPAGRVNSLAPPVALFSAALVALAPFQVHYAQEIRMYAQLAALVVACAWTLWRGMHSRSWGWWGAFAILAALAQYTHSLAAIYLFVLALTPVLARRRRDVIAVALAGLAALLLYLPWMVHLPEQIGKLQGDYWIAPPGAARLFSALLSYVTNLPVPQGWLPAALFITLLVLLLAGWQTVRFWLQIRSSSPDGSAHRAELRRGAWLAYLAFAPLVLLFLVSQLQPVFVERALLPAGVFFWMWVAWALLRTGLPRPVTWTAAIILVITFGLGLVQHITYRGFPYAPYMQMAEWLQAEAQPQDVILHSNKLTMLPLHYYAADLPQRYLADPPGSGSDTLSGYTQQILGVHAEETIERAVGSSGKVWLVIFEQAIQEYLDAGASNHPHLDWLERNFRQVQSMSWGDARIILYSR
jgi:4-amino-4-deoxy-L-arabinose transferase-like glycosyltransferase